MFPQTTLPTSLSCWDPFHAGLPSQVETPSDTSAVKVKGSKKCFTLSFKLKFFFVLLQKHVFHV